MKLMTSLFALIVCSSVFAQEKVLLDSKKVTVNSTQAVLVRTNKTPSKVKVTFNKIPMAESVCEQYSTRYVTRTSGAYCGYATTYRIINERVCTRTNPANRSCVRYENRQRRVAYTVARTCPVPETYCSQYGTSTNYESDTITIKFKNVAALADSEEDTFLVTAKQKRYDSSRITYDIETVETVQPYETKYKNFLGLGIFEKIVIKGQ